MLRWSRLRALVARILPRREPIDSLDAEIQTYLGCDIEARVRAGASPREARRAALADFGGVAQVKEQVREIRPGAWLDGLRQDIVYAFRALHHAPAFAWSVIGSLSLGIAAMVATIAFVNALLFRPFPGVADQDRLIEIKVLQAAGGEWVPTPTSTRDVDIVRNGFADAASVAAIETNAEVAVQVPDARVFNAAFVSVNYFDTLGVRAERGRTFALGEERPAASGVAVISHDAWERSFASDPQIVGRMARIGASRVQLIGVTPKGFVGIGQRMGRSGPDVWLPLGAADLVARSVPGWVSVPPSGEHLFRYVGRLAPQSRWARLRAEADAVASRMASERARAVDVRADVVPLRMQDPAQLAEFVATIVPVPILVLAIACLNAANLLLARGASRSREIAVRLAIGAGRSRLVRQLLVESVLLAMGAMPCALLLAWSGLRVAERSVLVPMPLDGTVLALTCAISVASAVAMGLVPALRATDRHAALALNPSMGSDATPRRSRGRRALVVVQVALSLTLLATGMHLISALQ